MNTIMNNIKAYIQGNIRYAFYNTNMDWIIRKHIREQITYRLLVMDRECYDEGSCKICGCMVPALQMADKSCPKPCYPKMMNKEQWEKYKKDNYIVIP